MFFEEKNSTNMGVYIAYIFTVLTFVTIFMCHAKPPVPEDIGTNFFLKASKSVPRIGRRTMEYENYFLKASKSIPRIGRRTLNSATRGNDENWQQDPLKRSFFEKYEEPVWSDIEKVYRDYPEAFHGDEAYSGAGIIPKPDPYWPRTKKDEEIVEEQPQNQTK